METPLAIVIAVDGLRASALGTYGNTTYPTPELDRLAAAGTVVEWFLASSPDDADFYKDVWHCTTPTQSETSVPWPAALTAAGGSTWFVTDDVSLATEARSAGFGETLSIALQPKLCPAIEASESSHAQFFTAAIEHVAAWRKEARQRGRGLLWLHTSGLTSAWDAPDALRRSLLDDEDVEPQFSYLPPRAIVCRDEDEAFELQISYAAQVAVLDACLASFGESIAEFCPIDEVVFAIVGTRGFSLGEHGMAGFACDSLFSEQLQLPCLVLNGNRSGPQRRIDGFVQPKNFGQSLKEWFSRGRPTADWHLAGGPCAYARHNSLRMLRTTAWMFTSDLEALAERLYSKPDDRWEMNDVASRCGEVVEHMKAALDSDNPCQKLEEMPTHNSWQQQLRAPL